MPYVRNADGDLVLQAEAPKYVRNADGDLVLAGGAEASPERPKKAPPTKKPVATPQYVRDADGDLVLVRPESTGPSKAALLEAITDAEKVSARLPPTARRCRAAREIASRTRCSKLTPLLAPPSPHPLRLQSRYFQVMESIPVTEHRDTDSDQLGNLGKGQIVEASKVRLCKTYADGSAAPPSIRLRVGGIEELLQPEGDYTGPKAWCSLTSADGGATYLEPLSTAKTDASRVRGAATLKLEAALEGDSAVLLWRCLRPCPATEHRGGDSAELGSLQPGQVLQKLKVRTVDGERRIFVQVTPNTALDGGRTGGAADYAGKKAWVYLTDYDGKLLLEPISEQEIKEAKQVEQLNRTTYFKAVSPLEVFDHRDRVLLTAGGT